MTALITGASSGIGKDMAIILSNLGYDLILVSRNKQELLLVQKLIKTNSKIIPLDLSVEENCFNLFEEVKNENIDILINNAGFGIYGFFDKTDIASEIKQLELNTKAVLILTKLFLPLMEKKNYGYILNVASSAAYLPGPLMSGYYASKAYVLRLTESIHGELKAKKSNVYIGALCPGPVDTNFNNNAGIKFSAPTISSYKVANYALKKMFKKKIVIVPGMHMKLSIFFVRFIPHCILIKIAYFIQRRKSIYE